MKGSQSCLELDSTLVGSEKAATCSKWSQSCLELDSTLVQEFYPESSYCICRNPALNWIALWYFTTMQSHSIFYVAILP